MLKEIITPHAIKSRYLLGQESEYNDSHVFAWTKVDQVKDEDQYKSTRSLKLMWSLEEKSVVSPTPTETNYLHLL
jgi:hypothetical protein